MSEPSPRARVPVPSGGVRRARRSLPTICTFVLLATLTLGSSALARHDVARTERDRLEARALDMARLVEASAARFDDLVIRAGLLAERTSGPAEFEARIRPALARSLARNVALIRIREGRVEVVAKSGMPLAAIARISPREWRGAIEATASQRAVFIGARREAGSPSASYFARVGGGRGEFIYAEIAPAPGLGEIFESSRDTDVALYAGGIELPATLIATNARSTPLGSKRVVRSVDLRQGFPGRLVVSPRAQMGGTFARRGPEMLLALGLVLAVGLAVLVEIMRRQRDRALELAGQLGASEARVRDLFERADDVVFTLDTGGRLAALNRSGARLLRRPRGWLVGRPLSDLATAEQAATLEREVALELAGESEGRRIEVELVRPDGGIVSVELNLQAIRADNEVVGIQGIARDTTERRATARELERRAFQDPLTGLANRRLLADRLSAALSARAPGQTVGVIVIDLDDFKTVNDSLGHEAGDRLLLDVARRIESVLGDDELCARLGGDEFAVMTSSVGTHADVLRLADRLLAALEAPIVIDGAEMFARASAGVAVAGGDTTAADLLRNADIAMYRAKSSPLAPSCVAFQPDMLEQVHRRRELLAELTHAVERGSFEVHYQPIVHLETGVVGSVEALVRWRHPERGMLSPDLFIGLAEETGMIVPMGEWILRQGCADMRTWFASEPDLLLSVNVSPRQLGEPGFVEMVRRVLAEESMPAGRMVFEITEGVLVDRQLAAGPLAELRGLGGRVAIDDFGTGYSSLDYMRRLPADILKIDKAFVSSGGESADAGFLSAIVQLATSLGLATVAEGIETDEQRAHILCTGCEYGQGYLFSRPRPAEELAADLARGFGVVGRAPTVV